MGSITDEELCEAVPIARSLWDLSRLLGLSQGGDTQARLRKRVDDLGLDTSHFSSHDRAPRVGRPLEEMLAKDSGPWGSKLRDRLFKEGVKERRCEECGIVKWRGRPAPLEIDHVDGDNKNNLLSNLMVLCRNCHGLTSTHSRGTKRKRENFCVECSVSIGPRSIRCRPCNLSRPRKTLSPREEFSHRRQRKVPRPSSDELSIMIWDRPVSTVAKEYGVSANAIIKWCVSYGIDRPGRGYWAKQR